MGGSLIVPEEIDVKFLSGLKKLLAERATQGDSFVLTPGGGRTARKYAVAAKVLGSLDRNDLDWLGIFSIRLNSLLLSNIFKNLKKVMVMDMKDIRPGASSDLSSVKYAIKSKANILINLTNVDYVYDKNPKTNKNAKPIKNISWQDFRKIIGNKWDPGLNLPFDPVASRLAEKNRLRVVVMNGNPLSNLKNFLSGKPYKGTIIG